MGPAHWILLACGVAGVLGATVLDAGASSGCDGAARAHPLVIRVHPGFPLTLGDYGPLLERLRGRADGVSPPMRHRTAGARGDLSLAR